MKDKKKKIQIATADEVAEYAQTNAPDASAEKAPEASTEQAPEAQTAGAQQQGAEAAAEAEPETDLQRAERERDDYKDKWLRSKADAQNQARRLGADREEAVRYSIASFVRSLLDVVDDMERSMEAAQAAIDAAQENKEAAAVAEGVRIVYDHLLKVLSDHHVERIEAVGRPFDPTCHEAMTQQPSADHPAGTVLQEVQKGYRLHDRVLRPTRVILSSAPPEPDSNAEAEPDDNTE